MSMPPDIPFQHHPRPHGRVLIIDDEPNVLAVGRAILEAEGYEVSTAISGLEVEHLVRTAMRSGQRYVVIILDLTMPGGPSGFEVLETILRVDPAASVIACSGYFQEDARELCQAIGFADVVQKPYTLDRLCAAVRRCLNRSLPRQVQHPDHSGTHPSAS